MKVGPVSGAPAAVARRSRRVPTLNLHLERSGRLAGLLVFMHVAAAMSVAAAPVPLGLRAACVSFLLMHAVACVRRHALLLTRESITSVRLIDEARCELGFRRGAVVTGSVDRSSVVLPWLVVLRVRVPNRHRRHGVVLMPDALGRDEFRRLRTRLRWSRIDTAHRGHAYRSL